MKDSPARDHIAFLNSGLDRAAHLRKQPAVLARALEDGAQVLPMWRGKPLLHVDDEQTRLVWLTADHPMLAKIQAEEMLFLGQSERRMYFSADISDWEPPELDVSALGAFFDPSVQRHPAAPHGSGFYELRGAMLHLSKWDAEIAAIGRALVTWHRDHIYCARCGEHSDFAEAGWQRNCASCGRHHFPRTDPVVIVLVTDGDRLLLGRSPGWPDGMYSLLAGFVEPGETLQAAAAREVYEESGIVINEARYLGCQPWPFPASLMVGMQAEARNTDIRLDPEELEDAIWASKQDIIEAMLGRNPCLKPARQGAIARAMIERWLAGKLPSA